MVYGPQFERPCLTSPWLISSTASSVISSTLSWRQIDHLSSRQLVIGSSALVVPYIHRAQTELISLSSHYSNLLFFHYFPSLWVDAFYTLSTKPKERREESKMDPQSSAWAQGWLHGCITCATTQGPALRSALHSVSCSAVTILRVFLIFEQGTLHFYLALGLTNYASWPA